MRKEKYRKSDFGVFLQEHRILCAVTLEQLSEGLCSVSELGRIERGKRQAGKALQDRLLYRLGLGPDVYENFLFEEDYLQWKKRQQLVYAISRRELEAAERILAEYREKYVTGQGDDVNGRLERQFCFSMEAQLLRSRGAERESEQEKLQEQLRILFRKALELTVCFAAPGSMKGKVCSIQELDLLLEWIYYERPVDWECLYREILYMIEEYRLDKVICAKIYSKTVYYLCRDGLSSGTWGLEERAEAMALF